MNSLYHWYTYILFKVFITYLNINIIYKEPN